MNIEKLIKPNRIKAHIKSLLSGFIVKKAENIKIYDIRQNDGKLDYKYSYKILDSCEFSTYGPFDAWESIENIISKELDYLKNVLNKKKKIDGLLKDEKFNELKEFLSQSEFAKYGTMKLFGDPGCEEEIRVIKDKISELVKFS